MHTDIIFRKKTSRYTTLLLFIKFFIGDTEWDGSEEDNEMSDVSTDVPNNVLMLEEVEWSATPSGSEMMVLVPTNQDSPTYEQIVALPSTSSSSSSSSQALALPSSLPQTSSSDDMAVAVPGERSIVTSESSK